MTFGGGGTLDGGGTLGGGSVAIVAMLRLRMLIQICGGKLVSSGLFRTAIKAGSLTPQGGVNVALPGSFGAG